MNLDSGWAAVFMMALIAIIGGIGKLIHMMYRMESELGGTVATLKDHGRRLEIVEKEINSLLSVVTRLYADSGKKP
jgi:hypothetical protein